MTVFAAKVFPGKVTGFGMVADKKEVLAVTTVLKGRISFLRESSQDALPLGANSVFSISLRKKIDPVFQEPFAHFFTKTGHGNRKAVGILSGR